MKRIRTEDAVGHVLCHDMTQIIRDQYKGARFRKGHVVTAEDIPVLLSMGKEHLYVWEMEPGMLHEDEGAARLAALCLGEGMSLSEAKEGKIEVFAQRDGLFQVDRGRLDSVNAVGEVMIATRHGNTAVRRGDKLAGTRVIPLVISEEVLRRAERAAGGSPLLSLHPWKLKTAAVITTGSEVAKGRVRDTFTPVVEEKLAAYGVAVTSRSMPGDGVDEIAGEILAARDAKVGMILCTGGMSVDPDDSTPGAIRAAGVDIVAYGAPVLPGAMFLLGYLGGTPVAGLPGCVMYAGATVFDLVLPRLVAGVRVTRADLTGMGEGGLCLGCDPCRYPMCPFGR